MKILAIGDFHGKFPEKLQNEAKKCDIVLCIGDFANADKIRKLIFKYWTDKSWIEVVGVKKARALEKESFDSGLKILKKLNSLNKKCFIIWGNTDFYENYKKSKKESRALFVGNYEKVIKKLENIILVDRKKKKIDRMEIIGHGRYLDITEYIRHPIDKEKKNQRERLRIYKKSEKELLEFFKRRKPAKKFIFLTHYTPYKILDKIKNRMSPLNKKNAGFEPYNKIIKKYKPMLCICGHIHENQGIKKLGKTIVVNIGAACDGKAALIEVEGQRIKGIKLLK
jgi:Icc-related predicted phosphoesterase